MSVVVVDWDETITTADTIKCLSDAAYSVKPDFEPKFSFFGKLYSDAMKAYKLEKVGSFNEEIQYQKGVKQIEMVSINALENYGVFAGLTSEDIRAHANNVSLKPNFLAFVNACKKIRVPIKILSINWSSILIREVLARNGISDIDVHCNELTFHNGTCTGKFDPTISIRTGFDKLQKLKEFSGKSRIIYVGDSRTDLLCLLHSSTGIVINNGSILTKMPWQVDIKNLRQYSPGHECLYTGDWNDITSFVQNHVRT